MSRSRTEYMKDRQGLEWLEVHFDADDGALEFLKAYCPLSDEWVLVDSDNLPRFTRAKIESFIADQIQTAKDHEEAV